MAKRATSEAAKIHWGDERALVSTAMRGRSDASQGKTPVAMAVGGMRQKRFRLANVTNQGKAR